MPPVKPVREPDDRNGHVRFDERGRETERWTSRRERQRKTPLAVGAAGPVRHRARPRLYQSLPPKLLRRARRDDAMDARGEVAGVTEDVQVAAKPRRRTYTAEYKRRILKEADACTAPGDGAIGALLRREGLYSSLLVEWRRARGRGELAALAPKKRGRKPTPVDPRDRKITELERQLAQMTGRAERAEVLVDAQKNLAALLGQPGATAP